VTRTVALIALGPFIGLGVWMLVVGFFIAGAAIKALERL
jgi:hypothetical protein